MTLVQTVNNYIEERQKYIRFIDKTMNNKLKTKESKSIRANLFFSIILVGLVYKQYNIIDATATSVWRM